MFIKSIGTSSLVIAAVLAGSQAFAQSSAPTDLQPAAPTATEPSPTAPAPVSRAPTPAQPGTTTVPASAPTDTAQTTPAPASDAAPMQTAQPAPAPAQPGAAAPAQSADAAPAASNGNTQVVAFVDQQFPTVDADKDGLLTQTEFEGWIGKLKAAELQSAGKPVNTAEVKTYAANAFLTADKDADKKVSKTEVTQFFSQG